MITMFLLNLLIAIGLIYFGFHGCAWLIAKYILETPEVEILAKVREIKNMAKEY